ncbi:hypothetical protein GW17_00034653 [Ensete ventricosum]|nr:hypothetical protein GW17_00034653 [Ensete ventricosum]
MVVLQDCYLNFEPTAIFFLEHQTGNNLTAHEVVCAPGVDEDDDGLLLKKPFDLQFSMGLCSRLSCAKEIDVIEV